MLQRSVYPYEYTDDWEKFIGTLLTEKEGFRLNMKDNAEPRLHAYKESLPRFWNKRI